MDKELANFIKAMAEVPERRHMDYPERKLAQSVLDLDSRLKAVEGERDRLQRIVDISQLQIEDCQQQLTDANNVALLLAERLTAAQEALRQIVQEQGIVCAGFELCGVEECFASSGGCDPRKANNSSYASWEIANQGLKNSGYVFPESPVSLR